MPLTPAEKMKRYREKLKNDPARYEEYKKKDLQRMKVKNKKISEMSDDEKEKVRKKWKEQKRNQKNKKSETNKKETKSTQKETSDLLIKKHTMVVRRWKRAYNHLAIKNEKLQRDKEGLRKKLYRVRKESFKEINKLNETIMKGKAREEVLECAMRKAYKNSKSQKEKRTFKSIARTDLCRQSKTKTYVAKLLGLKGRVRIITRQKTQNETIKKEIEPFFLREDVSRITSGKKECKTHKKKKEQIRYLTDTLKNLYSIYKSEGGKYSFVTFYRHKPFYVLSPNIQNRDSCLCIKHSNMEMLFSALLKNKVFGNDIKKLTDVLSCDVNSYDCMYGRCETCKEPIANFALEGDILNKRVQWDQWVRINHTYDKIEGKNLVQKTTKKTVKEQKRGTLSDLIKAFQNKIAEFKIHYFNWKHQQRKYRETIAQLGPTEALILCDFSENYECKLNEEVQASHFVKSQITLHCGMIYWANKSQSFCSISDNKCHEPTAIWAHLLPVIQIIKTTTPQVKTLHFYSDGPSSQYRQKKNFFLLNHYTTKLGFDYCTWNFSESGHGKGVADGIGGAVKRTLDKQVAYGRDVTDGTEAFKILESVSKSIKYFYIQDSEINAVNQSFDFGNLKAIPGTLRIHQIISHSHSSHIQHRVLSCFCHLDKDQACECFSLKKHKFPSNIVNNIQSINMPSTSKACNVNVNISHPEAIPPDPTSSIVAEANVPPPTKTPGSISAFDIASADFIVDCPEIHSSSDLNSTSISIIDPESIATSAVVTDCEKASSTLSIENGVPIIDLTLKDKIHCLKTSPVSNIVTNTVPVKIDLTNLNFSNSKQSLKRKSKTTSETLIKKAHISSNDKENTAAARNKNRSIRTVVSRCLTCSTCAKMVHFNSCDITKCIACLKWFCVNCTEGKVDFDYICRKCLDPDD